MNAKKVVVTDYTFPDLDQERAAALSHGAEFASFQCKNADDAADAADDASVVAVQFVDFPAAAIARLAPGATILRYGIGYDNIDVEAARARGIHVGYVPDYCIDEVAEHTVSMMLTLLRKIVPLDRSIRAGDWNAVGIAKPVKPFSETTIGFLGFGRIGSAVHLRLRPFGFRFIAADPGLTESHAASLGIGLVTTHELFGEADLLTLHAPATESTTEIVNAQNLARMKHTAFVVNTARGKLIDENALAKALTARQLAGAALDVFQAEPLAADSPLREAPNLLLTPHAAWYSESALRRLQALIAQDVERALRGEAPRRMVPGSQP
jgi:D-3-phosphoglycerate dehydrogenase